MRSSLVKRAAMTLAAAAAFTLAGTGVGQASAALVVQDMNHGTTAQQMAQALAGDGVAISNVTYTGAPNAAGSFTGGDGDALLGFNSGILLGSGSLQTTATSAECSKGVEGPNQCDSNTTNNARPGDVDLSTLANNETFDAAVLEFDFVPQFSTVQFNYVFSSDEYNEYVDQGVNDVFGFFVNGENCALVPETDQPVTIDTINLGSNFQYFRDNEGGTIDTEMDGLTVVLTCNADVNAGVTNHLKLAIADAGDSILDSNVFIQAGSLVSGTQISTNLTGGGQSGEEITVPSGTAVTDSATLTGIDANTATGTVSYTVYSDNSCSTVFASGGTKTVANGSVPSSDAVTFDEAGTFYWVASYSGDSGHNADANTCGSETVTVQGNTNTPAALTLAPQTASNQVGQQHCVTATVKNAAGNVVST